MVTQGAPYSAYAGTTRSHHSIVQQQAAHHDPPATEYISGHVFRVQAKKAGVNNPFASDWYPGLDIYQAVESSPVQPNTCTNVSQDDAVSAAAHELSSQRIDNPTLPAAEHLELPLSSQGARLTELPAQHPSPPPPTESKSLHTRPSTLVASNTTQSEFQNDFRHLRSLVTSGTQPARAPAPAIDITQPAQEEEDITYLTHYIHRGTTPALPTPALMCSSSPSPPLIPQIRPTLLDGENISMPTLLVIPPTPSPPVSIVTGESQAYQSKSKNKEGGGNATIDTSQVEAQQERDMDMGCNWEATPAVELAVLFAFYPPERDAGVDEQGSGVVGRDTVVGVDAQGSVVLDHAPAMPKEPSVVHASTMPSPIPSTTEEQKKEQEREQKGLEYRRSWGDGLVVGRGDDEEGERVLRVVNVDE